MELKSMMERANEPDAHPSSKNSLHVGKTTKCHQYLATVIICLSAMTAGISVSWGSQIFAQLSDVTAYQFSWIILAKLIGAIFGSIPIGILADKFGRKKTSIAIAALYIINYVAIAFCRTNIPMLYVTRFLIGIAIAGSFVVCPTYISEYAETSIRGSLGTFFYLFFTIGLPSVLLFNLSFRLFNLACSIIPILNLIGLCFIPESPVWLMKNHCETAAIKSIKWFWGPNCNANNATKAIQSELEAAGIRSGSFLSLFSVKAKRKSFFICLELAFFQQFSGFNVVMLYAELFIRSTGFDFRAINGNVIIGLVHIFMALVSAALIDRVGRKKMLLFSSSMMCLCLAALGYYFNINYDERDGSIGWIVLVSFFGFITSYSLGYGSVISVLMSEMLATDVKSVGTSITCAFIWLITFILSKTFNIFIENFGISITLWTYGAFMAIGTIFGIFVLFETKRKSYTEIQMKLAGEKYFYRS